MFYPELLTIVNDLFSLELIEELDTWLATLPKSHKDKITASKVSIKFDLDFNISVALLDECCAIGLLKKKFAIICPNCELVLKVTDENNIYDDLSNIDYCYNCEETSLGFTYENILILYSLVKKPTNNPDKIKSLIKKKTGINKNQSVHDTLKDLMVKSDYTANFIFYNPTKEELNKLKQLLDNVTITYKNTTEKGNALENLAEYILSLVKVFSVSRSVRTPTNQLDVVIRNKLVINSSVIQMMGTHCIVECKNEKEKPDNTYYHKLYSILHNANSRFGIIFSLQPSASTCKTIAREKFLLTKTIIINISYDDLLEIINNNRNLLDVIESKALEIQINPTKPLLESGLF